MRILYFISIALLTLSACAQAPAESKSTETEKAQGINHYGDRIEEVDVLSNTELMAQLENADGIECTFKGEILETCSKKGCWMTMDVGDENDMRIRFKDYGFFVPTEGQGGKTAVVKGVATKEVTSVDDLRHYAEDAGQSAEEIEAITEPEVNIAFEAVGVIIYD